MDIPVSVEGRTALAVARQCGATANEIIRQAFESRRGISIKGNRNIVTETDLAVELAVKGTLAEAFPAHAILSEETASGTRSEGWMWVCDPVDGTKNFAQGNPHFAFSLALCFNERPVLGVVTQPLLGWEFTAIRGAGCQLNGTPVMVTPRTSLRESVVAVDLGFDDELGACQLDLAMALWHDVQSLRIAGSAALGFAYVAAGKWDAYIHPALAPWDSAAGLLLVTEAGGVVSGPGAAPAGIRTRRVVAATAGIHAEFCALAARYEPPA